MVPPTATASVDTPQHEARSVHPLKVMASVSRLHIVVIAALGTFTFGWLFFGRHWPLLSLVCALDWFLVNLLNRVVDLAEDSANGIVGTDFVGRHRRGILVSGFSLLGVSLVATHLFAPALTPLRIAYHALGFTYNWPLFPRGRRIKQLYFWKNTASATGFLVTLFGYPFAIARTLGIHTFASGVTLGTVIVAALFFFTFELSYEVLYDLRDAEGDRLSGVATYPVVHGEVVATRIVDALLAVSMASLLIGYASGIVPWRLVVMVAAPGIQLVLYKRMLRRGITSADCINLTWLGALLLFVYHVWNALGLPGAS